jgi:hypothetical protein
LQSPQPLCLRGVAGHSAAAVGWALLSLALRDCDEPSAV